MIYLVLCAWFGIAGAVVARMKGVSMLLGFLISAILPVLGLLVLVLYRSDRDEPRRQCPGCGRVVPLHDALCTRCGTELDFPEVTLEAEASAHRS